MRTKIVRVQKRIRLSLLPVLLIVASASGCYIHSEEREELAKDIQTRYGSIAPAGLEVLESLDKDVERLLASRKADFDLLRETSALEIVDLNWDEAIEKANGINKELFLAWDSVRGEQQSENDIRTELEKRIAAFDERLAVMNKAIAKIENQKTTGERLTDSRNLIREITSSLHTILPAGGGRTPLDARLSAAIGDINTYLGSLHSERDKTEQTFSLILEGLRMGRDIVSLEQEVQQQELNYHERRLSLLGAKAQLAHQYRDAHDIATVFWPYSGHGSIQSTIADLASRAEAGDKQAAQDLRNILSRLGTLQTLRITTKAQIKEIDLRLEVEKYRKTRLLDATYERQRMALISYGLQGVVRYSQGGFRKEDVNRLMNIVQMIAQIVIAVKL